MMALCRGDSDHSYGNNGGDGASYMAKAIAMIAMVRVAAEATIIMTTWSQRWQRSWRKFWRWW